VPSSQHPPSRVGKIAIQGGIVLGILLIAILLTKGFGLWGGPDKSTGEAPPLVKHGSSVEIPDGSPLRTRIEVAPAALETINPKLVLPGIIESDPARTAAVLTPLSGRILELKVALGDRVTAGQVLALLDSPDLAQAYDDNDKAADAAELTDKNLHRQEEQFKLGTASARDLDQARSDHAQAAAEYTRTLAHLKVLGASPTAPRGARSLILRAPTAGSIISLAAAPGTMINDPTQPIMTIADLSTVWVTAQVSEKDVADVAKDQAADVDLEAYPGKTLHGKVLFVSDIIEADSRRNKIRIAFANADHLLKPNMFATVTLVGEKRSRIVLPTAALLMNNDRTSVFVETAPWTFERRVVQTQLEEGPTVAIGAGLNGGERVVVKGGILLND
jgi:cobalt-zinc-cadmium efflux system membrane fusion protein